VQSTDPILLLDQGSSKYLYSTGWHYVTSLCGS